VVVEEEEEEEEEEEVSAQAPAASFPPRLDLSFLPLSHAAATSLAGALPFLEGLRLRSCSLSQFPAPVLPPTSPRLQEVDLSYNPFLPSPSLAPLLTDLLRLPSLLRLGLDGCPSCLGPALALALAGRSSAGIPPLARLSLCDNAWSPAIWAQVLPQACAQSLRLHDLVLGEGRSGGDEGRGGEGGAEEGKEGLVGPEGGEEDVLDALFADVGGEERRELALSFPSSRPKPSLQPLLRALARPCGLLTHLDLSSSSLPYLSTDDVTQLFAALCHNTKLQSLDLSHAATFAPAPVVEPALRLLARALHSNPHARLRVLRLRGCRLGLRGLATLLAALPPVAPTEGARGSGALLSLLDLADNRDLGVVSAGCGGHDEAALFSLSQTLPQSFPPRGSQAWIAPGGRLDLSGNGLLGVMDELGWRSYGQLRRRMEMGRIDEDRVVFVNHGTKDDCEEGGREMTPSSPELGSARCFAADADSQWGEKTICETGTSH